MTVVKPAIGSPHIAGNVAPATNPVPTPSSAAEGRAGMPAQDPAPPAPNARPLVPTEVALTLPRAPGASATRGITSVSCSTTMPRFMAVGDSIAALLVDKHTVDGQRSPENTPPSQGKSTQDGRLPSEVLSWIEGQPTGTFAGKHMILSTGATNTQRTGDDALSPHQQAQEMALVQRQIQSLFAAGAASVTVLGVGTGISHASALDRQLSAAARANRASYTGPLEGTDHGRWHPRDPAATLRQAQRAYTENGC